MKKAAALWLARALQERMSQPGRRRKARQQRAGVGQRCEQLADGSCRGGGALEEQPPAPLCVSRKSGKRYGQRKRLRGCL